MPMGLLEGVDTGYSAIAPTVLQPGMLVDGQIRPMLLPITSVNHKAPSGPAVIPTGWLAAVGIEYSVTMPVVLIRPILLPPVSVNHNAPSGPDVMFCGLLEAVRTGYSVMTAAVVILPILFPPSSANHKAPSGPAVMLYA
jgi:hypothetical protein